MTTAAKFTGYKTTINGKSAFVVNQSADGTMLKVVFGKLIGYGGWSGGAYADYDYSGKRVWVRK